MIKYHINNLLRDDETNLDKHSIALLDHPCRNGMLRYSQLDLKAADAFEDILCYYS